ncbi:protein MKS1 [Carica papaya]|uniref:protein MKS1 n=1 Tax=Carica papaya TaxID=3649 RepID=UPI000B8CCBF9|nr:protein MKS1 [Carica papaya]
MDSSDFASTRSFKKEIQGPRPSPLKVHKDSYKIKKPPVAPQPPHHHHEPPQHRPPVIIYTVSPKVIHTNPSDFMTLVQRLTGSTSSSSRTGTVNTASNNGNCAGDISPAARYATVEKISRSSPEGKNKMMMMKIQSNEDDMGLVEGLEIDHVVERTSLFPGILSPGPSSLAPIPQSFFSPPSDPNSMFGFFNDLSPVLHGNKNFMEGNYMLSPTNFILPYTTSPPATTPSIDLFNNFFDL